MLVKQTLRLFLVYPGEGRYIITPLQWGLEKYWQIPTAWSRASSEMEEFGFYAPEEEETFTVGAVT